MNDFLNLTTSKMGNLGEEFIRNILEKQGNMVYKSLTNTGHFFDYLAINKLTKKQKLFEIKTKPRRLFYPDTGVDQKHFETYKEIKKQMNLDFYLFFLDSNNKIWYGNELAELEISTIQNKMVYFKLISMNLYGKLPDNIIEYLNANTIRNDLYKVKLEDKEILETLKLFKNYESIQKKMS